MSDDRDIRSVNEPQTTRDQMLTPLSINEPATLPDLPPPPEGAAPEHPIVIPPEEPAPEGYADPDELEDELEQAEEEGDFRPLHASKPAKSKAKKR